MKKFIYEVPPVISSEEPKMGGWGFCALLDCEFAMRARDTKIKEFTYRRLQEAGGIIISRVGLDNMGKVKPYRFMDESLLLHFAQVPGNACDLGIGHMFQGNFEEGDWEAHKAFYTQMIEAGEELGAISYDPHNVDTKDQAYALLSLWVHWANTANILLQED